MPKGECNQPQDRPDFWRPLKLRPSTREPSWLNGPKHHRPGAAPSYPRPLSVPPFSLMTGREQSPERCACPDISDELDLADERACSHWANHTYAGTVTTPDVVTVLEAPRPDPLGGDHAGIGTSGGEPPTSPPSREEPSSWRITTTASTTSHAKYA